MNFDLPADELQVIVQREDLGTTVVGSEDHADRHLAAKGRVVRLELDRLHDFSVLDEPHETAVVGVCLRRRLAALVGRLVGERDAEAAALAPIELVHVAGHPGRDHPLGYGIGVDDRKTGHDHARLAERAEELVWFDGIHAYMRMADGHCSALQVEVESGRFFCSAYATRPDVCRDLARGSGACRAELEAKAARPLLELGRRRAPA